MVSKTTTAQFLESIKNKDTTRYDYSKVEYVASNKYVVVTCKNHGDFRIQACFLKRGGGCAKCAYEQKSINYAKGSTEFVAEAVNRYGDVYDYSQVKYVNNLTKITIICNIHGAFSSSPAHHLKGRGCLLCLKDRKQFETRDRFEAKGKSFHSGKYSYETETRFVKSTKPVSIICTAHGLFRIAQAMYHFKDSGGCPACIVRKASSRIKPFEDFVEKAREVHGDLYDYSQADYKQREVKIKIVCQKGHEFMQTPQKHLLRRGCPTCKNSTGERAVTQLLEDLGLKFDTQKTFAECLGPESGIRLRFDFYLEDSNLLVEFDGEQHFKPVSFGADKETAQKRFDRQVIRDRAKEEFAKKADIKLLRLDYRDGKEIWLENLKAML